MHNLQVSEFKNIYKKWLIQPGYYVKITQQYANVPTYLMEYARK
jgi:hypothetical protein